MALYNVHKRLGLMMSERWCIDTQVGFHLFAIHSGRSFRKYYDYLCAEVYPREEAELAGWPADCGDQSQDGEAVGSKKKKSNHQVFADSSDAPNWHWRGTPRPGKLARIYHRVSLFFMLSTITKILFSELLFGLAHYLTGLPGHCVVIGRVILHPTLSGPLAFSVASLHVFWRYVQNYQTRPYMLSLFVFLMQTDHDVQRFHSIMAENSRESYLHQVVEAAPKRRDSGRLDRDPRDTTGPRCTTVSVHEYFMRHLMCSKIWIQGRNFYKLRPNRTPEACRVLRTYTNLTFVLCSILSSTLLVVQLYVIFRGSLSDQRYAQTYPGCDSRVDTLHGSGLLDQIPSLHRLLATLIDFLESFVVLGDTSTASVFPFGLIYLFSLDLELHWRSLQTRIEHTLEHAKALHQSQLNKPISFESTLYLVDEHLNVRRTPECVSKSTHDPEAKAKNRELEEKLNELQYELFDFFHQMDRVDRLVGDTFTCAIIVWLVLIYTLSYWYVRSANAAFPLSVKMTMAAGLLVITVVSRSILRLHKSCMRGHRSICSLTAYSSSASTKMMFIKVMEFFSDRQLTTFKLLRRYPFVGTTYMAIIGYTVTCVALVYALHGGQESRHKPSYTTPAIQTSETILGAREYSLF